jgi:hypothetical protein
LSKPKNDGDILAGIKHGQEILVSHGRKNISGDLLSIASFDHLRGSIFRLKETSWISEVMGNHGNFLQPTGVTLLNKPSGNLKSPWKMTYCRSFYL